MSSQQEKNKTETESALEKRLALEICKITAKKSSPAAADVAAAMVQQLTSAERQLTQHQLVLAVQQAAANSVSVTFIKDFSEKLSTCSAFSKVAQQFCKLRDEQL